MNSVIVQRIIDYRKSTTIYFKSTNQDDLGININSE